MKFISVLLAEVLSAKLLRAGARDENLMFISSTGSSRLAEKLEAGKKKTFTFHKKNINGKLLRSVSFYISPPPLLSCFFFLIPS